MSLFDDFARLKTFQKYNSLPKSETLIKFPDKFEMYYSIDFWTCTCYNQQCNSIEENMDSTRRGPKRDRFPFQNPLRLPTPSEVVFLDSDHGKGLRSCSTTENTFWLFAYIEQVSVKCNSIRTSQYFVFVCLFECLFLYVCLVGLYLSANTTIRRGKILVEKQTTCWWILNSVQACKDSLVPFKGDIRKISIVLAQVVHKSIMMCISLENILWSGTIMTINWRKNI